jgi:hypothetical protein
MSGNVIKVDGDYKVVAKGGNITLDTTSDNGNVNIIGNLLVSGTTNILPGEGSSGISVTVSTFTGEINGTTLTVTDCPADGLISAQQYVIGVGVANDTFIVQQLTGTSGGNGTYTVSISQHVGPIDMTVSALFITGSIKLSEGQGIYVQDEHDYDLYDLLIGIKEEEATVHIGGINTNGLSLSNNKEYKIESALNVGTFMAVAKVDANDNVILGSGNSNTTQIRAGGITSVDYPYGIEIKNGGEIHIPVSLNIGSNRNNQAFGASLEICSDALIDGTGGYAGISLVSYRTTDQNGPFGSFAYGARYRGSTNAPAAVAQDDVLMEFGALGWDGAALNGGGEILWAVDGTVVQGSKNPSRIEFYNTPTNAKDQTLNMILHATKTLEVVGRIQTNGSVPDHNYGAAGDKAGMIAFDSSYIYYCTADYVDNSTVIWKRTAHGSTTW